MMRFRSPEPDQYGEFLDIMRAQAGDYLLRTMELMEMSWERFRQLFTSVGDVMGFYDGEDLAGFYWVELRDRVLHVHALMVLEGHQGRGIGTEILNVLENRYRSRATHIEMGVHESNRRARALYERLGYSTVTVLERLGFEVLRKQLSP